MIFDKQRYFLSFFSHRSPSCSSYGEIYHPPFFRITLTLEIAVGDKLEKMEKQNLDQTGWEKVSRKERNQEEECCSTKNEYHFLKIISLFQSMHLPHNIACLHLNGNHVSSPDSACHTGTHLADYIFSHCSIFVISIMQTSMKGDTLTVRMIPRKWDEMTSYSSQSLVGSEHLSQYRHMQILAQSLSPLILQASQSFLIVFASQASFLNKYFAYFSDIASVKQLKGVMYMIILLKIFTFLFFQQVCLEGRSLRVDHQLC